MIAEHFRIRCSALHSILTNIKAPGLTAKQHDEMKDLQDCRDGKLMTPTGKPATFTANRKERLAELENEHDNPSPDVLPSGAKTYCDNWLSDFIYGRRSDFGSKQTEKGTRTEDECIEILRDYLQDPFLPGKNAWRVVGEYMEGECDLRYGIVWDIKSAYTHATMPLWDTEPIATNRDQLQGYCELFSAKRAGVAKVLCNMPDDMILREAYYKVKGAKGPDYTEVHLQKVIDKLTHRYTYDDVPLTMRVHTITFDKDPDFVGHVERRVKMCREYITQKFNELPHDKRDAAAAYVTERMERQHRKTIKAINARANEWRERNLNQPETAQ